MFRRGSTSPTWNITSPATKWRKPVTCFPGEPSKQRCFVLFIPLLIYFCSSSTYMLIFFIQHGVPSKLNRLWIAATCWWQRRTCTACVRSPPGRALLTSSPDKRWAPWWRSRPRRSTRSSSLSNSAPTTQPEWRSLRWNGDFLFIYFFKYTIVVLVSYVYKSHFDEEIAYAQAKTLTVHSDNVCVSFLSDISSPMPETPPKWSSSRSWKSSTRWRRRKRIDDDGANDNGGVWWPPAPDKNTVWITSGPVTVRCWSSDATPPHCTTAGAGSLSCCPLYTNLYIIYILDILYYLLILKQCYSTLEAFLWP